MTARLHETTTFHGQFRARQPGGTLKIYNHVTYRVENSLPCPPFIQAPSPISLLEDERSRKQ